MLVGYDNNNNDKNADSSGSSSSTGSSGGGFVIQYFDDHIFFMAKSIKANFTDGCSITYDNSDSDMILFEKLPSTVVIDKMDDSLLLSKTIKYFDHTSDLCKHKENYNVRLVFTSPETETTTQSKSSKQSSHTTTTTTAHHYASLHNNNKKDKFDWRLSNVWMSYNSYDDSTNATSTTTTAATLLSSAKNTNNNIMNETEEAMIADRMAPLPTSTSLLSPDYIYWNVDHNIDSQILSYSSETLFACKTIEFDTFQSVEEIEQKQKSKTSSSSSKLYQPSLILEDVIFGVHLNGRSQETGKGHKLFSHHDNKDDCHIIDGTLTFQPKPKHQHISQHSQDQDSGIYYHNKPGHNNSQTTYTVLTIACVVFVLSILLWVFLSFFLNRYYGTSYQHLSMDEDSDYKDVDDDDNEYVEDHLSLKQFKDTEANNHDNESSDDDDNTDDSESNEEEEVVDQEENVKKVFSYYEA